jgi:hypothetical protein
MEETTPKKDFRHEMLITFFFKLENLPNFEKWNVMRTEEPELGNIQVSDKVLWKNSQQCV